MQNALVQWHQLGFTWAQWTSKKIYSYKDLPERSSRKIKVTWFQSSHKYSIYLVNITVQDSEIRLFYNQYILYRNDFLMIWFTILVFGTRFPNFIVFLLLFADLNLTACCDGPLSSASWLSFSTWIIFLQIIFVWELLWLQNFDKQ